MNSVTTNHTHTVADNDIGHRTSDIGHNRYIHPLTIGPLTLQNNLCLAPMAGFTNVAFRLIAK